MGNRLRTWLIVVVSVVWAVNFIAPIFTRDFKPAPELHVAFMAIIGGLVASYKKDDNDDNTSNSNKDREGVGP